MWGPPYASNETFTAAENAVLSESASTGVLANNGGNVGAPGYVRPVGIYSVDGGTPSVGHPVITSAGGTLTLNLDGSFTYVPLHGFAGTDSADYTVTDGLGISNYATITFSVAPGSLIVGGINSSTVVGEPSTLIVAHFTDPSNIGDYAASIDWGNGEGWSSGTISQDGSGWNVLGTQTYSAISSFPVTTVIESDAGGYTVSSTVTVTSQLPDLQWSQPSSHPGVPVGADTFITTDKGVNFGIVVIAASNLDGKPDDTLTLTGNIGDSGDFSNTQLIVYGQTSSTDGTIADADIQDGTSSGVLATIPASEPGNSMYLIWPKNSRGTGFASGNQPN